jgi:hypothetical protein
MRILRRKIRLQAKTKNNPLKNQANLKNRINLRNLYITNQKINKNRGLLQFFVAKKVPCPKAKKSKIDQVVSQ